MAPASTAPQSMRARRARPPSGCSAGGWMQPEATPIYGRTGMEARGEDFAELTQQYVAATEARLALILADLPAAPEALATYRSWPTGSGIGPGLGRRGRSERLTLLTPSARPVDHVVRPVWDRAVPRRSTRPVTTRRSRGPVTGFSKTKTVLLTSRKPHSSTCWCGRLGKEVVTQSGCQTRPRRPATADRPTGLGRRRRAART